MCLEWGKFWRLGWNASVRFGGAIFDFRSFCLELGFETWDSTRVGLHSNL